MVEAQGGEERAKYGDGLIKQYSEKLTNEINKGYTISSLKRMRQFYIVIQIGATMSHQLSWSHYVELLPFKDINKIKYYINLVENYNLSIRELREKIKFNEYERLDEKTKLKLIDEEKLEVSDFVKNPIIINNSKKYEVINEKILKELILEDITSFMKELGNGFSFIDSEYKIKIRNSYNYIDLLFFNILYNCYVVVELKVTELRKSI